MGEFTNEQQVGEIGGSRRLVAFTAAPALAGSVTQPGETVGLNTGAPLPQGWYVINTVDWGCNAPQIPAFQAVATTPVTGLVPLHSDYDSLA
jgi:hypothetical protein